DQPQLLQRLPGRLAAAHVLCMAGVALRAAASCARFHPQRAATGQAARRLTQDLMHPLLGDTQAPPDLREGQPFVAQLGAPLAKSKVELLAAAKPAHRLSPLASVVFSAATTACSLCSTPGLRWTRSKQRTFRRVCLRRRYSEHLDMSGSWEWASLLCQ